jgi:outer membrane protein TolC
VVFYAWLRGRATIVVAGQALADQRTHLADVEKLVQVGRATLADQARARTGVANAELNLTDAKTGAAILERQVRIAVHAADDEPLAPGEDLGGIPPPMKEDFAALLSEARTGRLELRSLDASIAALDAQARTARAAMAPSLSLFADATYANPSPRYQPPADRWLTTWAAGALVTWSPNDLPLGSAAGREADAKTRQLLAHRGEMRDGIDLEVQRAFEDAVRSDAAIAAGDQELASATEAYRVAHAVFLVGQLSSTTLTDAEVELTRARLHVVDSRTDARISRARLSFALGRETRGP